MSDSDSNGSSMLSIFATDFDERVGQEKLSLSQCLRRACSSKQIVSKHVQRLLEQPISSDQLRTECEILHSVNLRSLSKAISGASTMLYLKQVSVVISFVHLVLESASKQELVPPREYNNMVTALLQGLSESICALLQVTTDDNFSSTTLTCKDENLIPIDRLDRNIVGSFAVAALVRIINPYVSYMPFLLAPLWKGICDVGCRLDSLTQELAKETLMALVTYLAEGERQCTLSLLEYLKQRKERNSCHENKAHFFHIKVLSFLVARLSILLPIYLKTIQFEDDDSTTLEMMSCMTCRIFGIRLAVTNQLHNPDLNQQDQVVLQQYAHLEKKAEQCILKAISCDEGKLQAHFVKQLLAASKSTANKSRELRSFFLGKLLTLHQILEIPSIDGADSELQLLVCQDIIFSTIPLCFEYFPNTSDSNSNSNEFYSLLSKSIRLISSVLAQVEVYTIRKAIPLSRRHLHGVILKWLAPSTTMRLHPSTRELLLSSILQYCHFLYSVPSQSAESPRAVQMAPDSSDQSRLFLGALTSILFDPRTQRLHRENVAGLLIRMLIECGGSASGRCQRTAQSMVAEHLASVMKKEAAATRRKRKRIDATKDTCFSFDQFGVDNVLIICSVLQCVKRCENSYLRERFCTIRRQLGESRLASTEELGMHGAFGIGKSHPVEVALVMAYMSGLFVERSSGVNIHELEETTGKLAFTSGSESESLLLLISEWFLLHAKQHSRRSLRSSKISVVFSTLKLLGSGVSYTGARATSQQVVNSVVESMSMCSLMLGKLMRDSQRQALLLALEIVSFLGKIGSIIRANCPSEIVQTIASTFKNILLLNLWPIASEGITSLTTFASTLPAAHKGILPKCFPIEMQAFLKARLQGIIHRKQEAHNDESSFDVHFSCAKMLIKLVPRAPAQIFPDTGVCLIEPGSYFISMPTTEGRSALVFFPPGEQSIQDIKCMLGTNCIDNVGVQTLQRVMVLDSGANGCRIFSKNFK